MTDEPTVEDLLGQLTLDEKAALTAGVDMWHGASVPRLGIPALKVTDGPVGARGERWVGTTSACAPCGTALGVTWNPELVREVGEVLGAETRTKSADVLLAPTVNLHRNPLAGRNFECFSEDPVLTAVLAVAFIHGVQSTGVAACVKHFVANDSEYQRHTISSEVDQRTLRELYLWPFEAAVVAGGVMSVMAAYNRLNGVYCAESTELLIDLLKVEWGFDGVVMSDWWGAKSGASAGGGLDLEMPGPAVHLGAGLADRVHDGDLDESILDDMVSRLLLLQERLGLLSGNERPAERSEDRPEQAEVLRRAAEEAVVLLRNDDVDGTPLLPLVVDSSTTIAVIGPNADAATILGGGSAAVNPHHFSTVLDGLRRRLGDSVEVLHEPGVAVGGSLHPIDARSTRPTDASVGDSGLTLDYYDNRDLDGDPVYTERCAASRLIWLGDPGHGLTAGGFSVRVSGWFRPARSGRYVFGLVSGGSARVAIDGNVVLDNFDEWVPGSAFFGLGSEEVRTEVDLEAGREVEIVTEFVPFEGIAAGAVMVGMAEPLPDDAMDRAVAAATAADVAIVVVGLDQDSETEGEDRATFELPGGQGDLIRAVVEANPRTVVLVNAGSAVDLSPAADVPALAQMWYLGQETGDAVAALLTGDVSPSGRLPTTLGKRLSDWPSWFNYPGEGSEVLYGEQVFMGYRGFDAREVEPAFCFGHGLGYSTFEWSDPSVSHDSIALDDIDRDGAITVSVSVTNTGARRAAEVVQCYVTDEVASVRRPPKELRAFAKLALDPGESRRVSLDLDRRAFSFWDLDHGCWTVEVGRFELLLAASASDIRAAIHLEVTA